MSVTAEEKEDKSEKRKEASAVKRATAEVESIIEDAQVTAAKAKLDAELLLVEAAGFSLAEDWRQTDRSPEELAAEIQKQAAEERSSYRERFKIDCKGKAGWSASKIAEARTSLEDVKALMKAEIKRGERDLGGRLEFFEGKLLAWADPEPKDKGTKGSIRFPEYGVRVEVRTVEFGGVTILDEKALVEELVNELGIAEAVDLGIVKLAPTLVEGAAKEFLEAHPGLSLKNAVVEPKAMGKRLVVTRMSR